MTNQERLAGLLGEDAIAKATCEECPFVLRSPECNNAPKCPRSMTRIKPLELLVDIAEERLGTVCSTEARAKWAISALNNLEKLKEENDEATR